MTMKLLQNNILVLMIVYCFLSDTITIDNKLSEKSIMVFETIKYENLPLLVQKV